MNRLVNKDSVFSLLVLSSPSSPDSLPSYSHSLPTSPSALPSDSNIYTYSPYKSIDNLSDFTLFFRIIIIIQQLLHINRTAASKKGRKAVVLDTFVPQPTPKCLIKIKKMSHRLAEYGRAGLLGFTGTL